ncbi:hypothetical protein [Aureimonas leprariae]|uniref:Uncharacterized protein n=1 Tax=Plantimonas leprariae TaxID=2615207 RepID=A0A7V7TYR9_9HYPH|nr:hypothetical protein [Aureimonas leprariae]KAB0677745.1 hypothetical protein F6X38_17340 [Aureimonas leprariae]
MQTDRIETHLIVAKGSDGKVYDLHRISYRERPKALGSNAAWSETAVEWLMSNGALVETADETTFRLPGGELLLTKLKDIAAAAAGN